MYKRAGIIPVIQYNNQLAVILFKQKRNGQWIYTDGGGRRNEETDPRVTACRELQEESKNMFQLNPNLLEVSWTHTTVKGKYKLLNYMFFIGVKDIDLSIYHYNKERIKTDIPDWMETHDVNLFYLSDLNHDVWGNPCILHELTRMSIEQGLNKTLIFKTLLLITNHTNDFLDGTKSYL